MGAKESKVVNEPITQSANQIPEICIPHIQKALSKSQSQSQPPPLPPSPLPPSLKKNSEVPVQSGPFVGGKNRKRKSKRVKRGKRKSVRR